MKLALKTILIALMLFGAVPHAKADQTIALANGTSVDVVSVGPGQPDTAFTIQYRTTLPFDDKAALRIQADAVWNHFAPDIEQRNADHVTLSALSDAGQSDFDLQKQNGNWRMDDFKPGETARLTDDIVKKIMNESDAAMVQHESNALLLYLDDDWTVTENYKKNEMPVSKTESRAESVGKMTSDMAQNYKHSRDIYNVTISDDGQTAKIESYETESGILKGHSFTATEHSLDNMAIVGSSIVLTKSQSDLSVQAVTGATTVSKNSNARGFKSALFARLIPLGIIYTPISLVMVWLSWSKLQKLKALEYSGTQTRGVITDYKTYKTRNNYQTAMDTARKIKEMKDEGADKETISKSIRDRTIQQTVRKGLSIRYEFQTAAGNTQKGRLKIMGSRVPNPEKYVVNSNVEILYLERSASSNFIKDLLEAGIGQTSTSLRQVLWSLFFIALIDIADVMAYLNVF